MEFEVGTILEGTVTGITKFGAFVSLGSNKSGLVHISEISNSYVNDVNEFLSVGQKTKVKIIGIDENGRINLSIKKALPPPAPQAGNRPPRRPAPPAAAAPVAQVVHTPEGVVNGPSGDSSFEDKLKRFMQDSNTKISGCKQYADRKSGNRRGRG